MTLDAGRALKRAVVCLRCHEERLFTLREIADHPQLKCAGCGGSICTSDRDYEPLLRDVRNALAAIDSAQSRPSFIGSAYSNGGARNHHSGNEIFGA